MQYASRRGLKPFMDRHGRGHGGAGQGDGFLGGGSILDLEGLTRIVTEPYTLLFRGQLEINKPMV